MKKYLWSMLVMSAASMTGVRADGDSLKTILVSVSECTKRAPQDMPDLDPDHSKYIKKSVATITGILVGDSKFSDKTEVAAMGGWLSLETATYTNAQNELDPVGPEKLSINVEVTTDKGDPMFPALEMMVSKSFSGLMSQGSCKSDKDVGEFSVDILVLNKDIGKK